MLTELKNYSIFDVINGVLIGKPADESFFEEYKQILREEIDNPALPIVANINVGHSIPRCIIPFGVPAVIDVNKQSILFEEHSFYK